MHECMQSVESKAKPRAREREHNSKQNLQTKRNAPHIFALTQTHWIVTVFAETCAFSSLSLFLSFFIRSFSRTHCIASNSSTYYFNFSETLKFEKVSNEFFFIGYISIEWVVQVVVWCMCVGCLSVCPFICITFWKQRFNKFDCENRISR